LSGDLAEKVAEIGDGVNFEYWRRRLFADDLMVGLLMEGVGADKLAILADFEFNGVHSRCSEEALFQFNVDVGSMRKLWENDLIMEEGEGGNHCEGVNFMCCG
tara:strand:+ start:870 stop:1178 length:309 start_codon:yes stop_codon:yes gene_type:complete